MRWMKLTVSLAIVAVAALLFVQRFDPPDVRRLQSQVDELERERAELLAYAERLTASRRVAQVDVVRQRIDSLGRTVTTLLWQEIRSDGLLAPPRAIEAVGSLVYFEALLIKFEYGFVGAGDAQRGTSLALFRRVFGDAQSPDSATQLDPLTPPLAIEHDTPATFSNRLWRRFWEFVEDPKLAAEYGVRVAQVEAPAVLLEEGQVWEVRLDAIGGLNLQKIGKRVPHGILDSGYGMAERP